MPNQKLEQDIKYLKGVGPKRAELLNAELKIFNIKDLLYYFPYKYIDRTKFYSIRELKSDMAYIQVIGKISYFETIGVKRKQRLVAYFTDSTGILELVWFKGTQWIKQNIKENTEYIVFGKPSVFNGKINIIHPEMEEYSKQQEKLDYSFQAYYNTSEKLKKNFVNSKVIHTLIHNALQLVQNNIPETIPEYLIKEHKLLNLQEALLNIHLPSSHELLLKAKFRLKFEELLYIQLNILQQKIKRKEKSNGFNFSKVGKYFHEFYEKNLPFELTNAQKKVIKEIRIDLGSGKQMNRLLQGDVGSGKTLVALMTMLIAIDNNYQACLMAPTEVLANQHFNTITQFLKHINLNIALLTGSTRQKERKILHQQLSDGDLNILIGTHALIEDTVKFKNLGFVVIDEQHRFGVAQRAKLWKKNVQAPHILVMTATPIPRTLAMTVYGDLDVSIIDELPPGRKPVKTIHAYDSKRLRIFGFIKEQIKKGRQVYIVYPLIKESEKMDYKDLEDGYESISRAFPPPEYGVSIVHGRMKQVDKEKSMQLFINKSAQIMVATTVIEVGVDVPNASVMIIESAERFGLSQLHQLRGRVGRGADQSYCILMTSFKLSNEARRRIEIMTQTNDGFEISEADLKLRGPGDIEGTQQSGIPFDLKITNLAKDSQILTLSRSIANEILEKDSDLTDEKNRILSLNLQKMKQFKIDWSDIS
ncbi:MAG: ATP-dependent DNA helicase RecG [Chlorobi bacterium]|nr:ATP-dependent DNA helicase RecG [Chlorobiota bacterium]